MMLPPGITPGMMAQAPARPGAGLGMDPQQLAMMLLGAGSGLGRAASPSQFPTGIGTALGAGLGGGAAGLMQHDAAQKNARYDEVMDQILQEQMRQAGAAPAGTLPGGGATARLGAPMQLLGQNPTLAQYLMQLLR